MLCKDRQPDIWISIAQYGYSGSARPYSEPSRQDLKIVASRPTETLEIGWPDIGSKLRTGTCDGAGMVERTRENAALCFFLRESNHT